MSTSRKVQPFESTMVAGDEFLRVYESMLVSDAFMDLTKNQKLLYMYCKAQYFGKRKPRNDYEDIKAFSHNECFYFPMSTAEKYGLYSRSNHQAFYTDMQELVNHGLIKVVSSGKSTKSKSIYRFSEDWKRWKKDGKN